MSECKICQMPASGLHFSVSCCRACAAFFRRTNQLKLKYKCRFEGHCDVTKKNRYSCRHCRFKKCLSIGMGYNGNASMSPQSPSEQCSPDNEQTTRQESVIEPVQQQHQQHQQQQPLPQQQQQHPHQPLPQYPQQDNAEPSYRIPTIVRNESIFMPGTSQEVVQDVNYNYQEVIRSNLEVIFSQSKMTPFPYSIPLSLCQQALVAYTNHNAEWPDCAPGRIKEQREINIKDLMNTHHQEVKNVGHFCMSIGPFADLPIDQKWVIFKHFWPRFVEFHKTFVTCNLLGYDVNDDRVVGFDGQILSFTCHINRIEDISDMGEDEIRRYMQDSNEVFKKIFTIPFKNYRPDQFELMYMIVSTMWNLKDISPATKAIADQVRHRLSEDLYNYYRFELNQPNYADRIYKLSHLVIALDRVIERRREDSQMSRTFNIFKQDIYLNDLII